MRNPLSLPLVRRPRLRRRRVLHEPASDSSVEKVWRSPADTPSGPAGDSPDGRLHPQVAPHFQGLNGGPDFSFNEAVSFVIECEDQDEVDRLWDALTADGGEPGPCGWLGPIRPVVADRAAPAERAGWRSRSGACAPRHGGDAQDGQDRCRGTPAGGHALGSSLVCRRIDLHHGCSDGYVEDEAGAFGWVNRIKVTRSSLSRCSHCHHGLRGGSAGFVLLATAPRRHRSLDRAGRRSATPISIRAGAARHRRLPADRPCRRGTG